MKPLVITPQITKKETDSLQKYLNEVAKIKLLTKEEELEISTKAFAGDKKAIEDLARANLRFVVSVAKQYQTKGVMLEDLISEGNHGLYIAAQKFDPELGNKFISFAVYWVRNKVLKYLNEHSRTVPIPVNKSNNARKLKRYISNLEQRLQRTPTIDEIYEEVQDNYSYKQIKTAFEADRTNVVSYDYVDEDGNTLIDSMSSDWFDAPNHLVRKDDIANRIDALLINVPSRERDFIIRYYGLKGCKQQNVREIAEYWQISDYTVRNGRDKYLRRMKSRIIHSGSEPFFKTL